MLSIYPCKLSQLPYSVLKTLVPELVKVSEKRLKPYWGNENHIPVWWPQTIPYCNPSKGPKLSPGTWTKMLKSAARACYEHHGLTELTGRLTNNLYDTSSSLDWYKSLVFFSHYYGHFFSYLLPPQFMYSYKALTKARLLRNFSNFFPSDFPTLR